MGEKLLKATHEAKLKIGDTEIPCAVLEDYTRVLRERSVAKSLGKKGSGTHWEKKRKEEKGALLPEYVSLKNLEPFIDSETREMLMKPISYKTKTGSIAKGLPATLLPTICDIWLKAREKGALSKKQLETANKAEILMRGFAQIGIIALVDEATGYQEVRDRFALQQILEKYISKELLSWAKRFPDSFYQELFKLRGWSYSPLSVKRPSIVGRLTNNIVYERLAPGVLEELKRKNPVTGKGYRKHRHHQWLTEDVGHPALANHLYATIGFMRASANWSNFERLLDRAYPRLNQTLPLPFPEQELDEDRL